MKTKPASSLLSRRNFLRSSAKLASCTAIAASAPRYLSAAERTRSIGANSRIRIAQIGCGGRGVNAHMVGIHKHVAAANFEIVAVSDPWRDARERANAKVREWFGRDARQCVSYRDVLTMPDVDAVMIASPDHHHTDQLEAAAKAGKHIYIEKPLATELPKLLRAYDASKTAEKRGSIIQVGTQLRSYPGIVGARELLRTGTIGKLTRIDEIRNSERPYWYNYLKADLKEADVDWREFLGDRKMRPFDWRQYSAWYGYYDFCQGPIPQWGAHFLDMMHYVTGCGFPESCMCLGGVTYWKDENKFTVPDNVAAMWMYPDGLMVTSSNNFGNSSGNLRRFYGDKGTLNIDNWNVPTYSAEGGPKRDGKIRGKLEVPPIERPDHFLDWLQCLRDGRTPHASIDAGYQHAIAVLMAVISYETGRKTTYNHGKRTIVTV